MPKRATSTSFKPGDPRAAAGGRKGSATLRERRRIGPPPLTAAQEVMKAFQQMVPDAMRVLATAVAEGDRKVALAITDKAAPPERLMALEARAQIDALQLALQERDEQIEDLQAIIDDLTGEARGQAA